MNLIAWYQKRGLSFILERAKKLNERYSFTARKSIDRIMRCMDTLCEVGCYPTYAVPGIIVEQNSPFIRRLQEAGAEVAVHGYKHVDMKTYSPEEGSRQLNRAAAVFRLNGLKVHGFRCPYLSATDELIKVLPPNVFEYSSNKAIQWPIILSSDMPQSLLFKTIDEFYQPLQAKSTLCLPWFQDGVVEIPVCVPDDLQLHDGLGYEEDQIAQVWMDILDQTYQRGEVFNLIFHPELSSFCEMPFLRVIEAAKILKPKVWFTQLWEICAWWKEKANFRVEIKYAQDHSTLEFQCTPRGAVYCRGFDPDTPSTLWDGVYQRLETRRLEINGPILPVLGVSPEAPIWVETSLARMGYILEKGETAHCCSLYIDETFIQGIENPVDLIAKIERTPVPLVRFWPWPDGARSAICVTGDLDALSLTDYLLRLIDL